MNSQLAHYPAPELVAAVREALKPFIGPAEAPAHPLRRQTDLVLVPRTATGPRVTPAPKAPGRPGKRSRMPYTPRVVYHPTSRRPSVRSPLPATESAVYAYLTKHPGATARATQTALSLRDGQLWGAIRRLTLAKLIRTVAAK